MIPFEENERILLPAYIGWSPKEGSGVFDPIAQLGLTFDFYKVDDHLRIDLEHLRNLFSRYPVKVLVIIHYYGYIDPGYTEAVAIAREFGALILEDEAHAMLTDLVGGLSGRLGDACIFSLHKILPLKKGGMLMVNHARGTFLESITVAEPKSYFPWEFDLKEISVRRQQNVQLLSELIKPLAASIEPLWGDPKPGEILQTYPIIVHNISRDNLYFTMNSIGFGVVSLYHTLIKEITVDAFPASHLLSHRILNLPIHQDVRPKDLEALVKLLSDSISICSK